jgi:hypothetical protein
MVSLRDGDWKLIVHTDNRKIIKAGSQELYNILKDPYEKANLAEVEKDISFKLCNDISNWIETMSKNAFEVELNVKTEAELDQLRSLEYIN